MTVVERESYAASLREPAAGDSFQLARAIGQPGLALVRGADAGAGEGGIGDSEDEPGMVCSVHSAGRERSKLSQLLFKLLSNTRLHQVGRGPRGHADQHLVLPHPHAAFAAMLQGRLPEGPTLLDLLLAPA